MTVTSLIRDAILSGDLVPNQRLVQVDLSEQYGAPRSSVREALAELTKEGLVEWLPNKGARVRVVSLDEAIEISELRMVIEAFLASRAAERVNDEQIQELRELGLLMKACVAEGDLMGYSAGNRRLHEAIRTLSGHASAARLLEGLRGQSVRHQFRLAMQPGRATVSLPEHLEIIDAVCAHDAPAAGAAMTKHMKSVIDALRDAESRAASARP